MNAFAGIMPKGVETNSKGKQVRQCQLLGNREKHKSHLLSMCVVLIQVKVAYLHTTMNGLKGMY